MDSKSADLLLQIFKNRCIEKFWDRNTQPIAKFLHSNHGIYGVKIDAYGDLFSAPLDIIQKSPYYALVKARMNELLNR